MPRSRAFGLLFLATLPRVALAADPTPPAAAPSTPTATATVPAGLVVEAQANTRGGFDALKGKTIQTFELLLRSGSRSEQVIASPELQAMLKAAGAGDVQADLATAGFTIRAAAPTPEGKAAARTLSGDKLASALTQLTVRLSPMKTTRTLVVHWWDATGAAQAPIEVPLEVTIDDGDMLVRADVLQVDHSTSDEPNARRSLVGQYLARPDAAGWVLGGKLRSVTLTGADLTGGDTMGLVREQAGCTQTSATAVTCTAPEGGWTVDGALAALQGVELTTARGYQQRTFRVMGEWETDVDGTTTKQSFPLVTLAVAPELPRFPAECLEFSLDRHGPGLDTRRAGTARVLRYEEVVTSAVASTYWPAAKKMPAACGAFLEAHREDGLEIRLALTKGATNTELCDEAEDGCTMAVLSTPTALAPLSKDAKAVATMPFASSWGTLNDKGGWEADADGGYHLYAHALLRSSDGSNEQPIRSNVDLNAMVDYGPLWTLEIVNHPLSTAVTVLDCRDVIGLEGVEADAAACGNAPDRLIASASVATIPFGLKLRWNPFYQREWLGFSAEANFLSLGAKTVLDGAAAESTSAGLTTPMNLLLGVDLNGQLDGDGAASNRVGFMLSGGTSLVRGAEGYVFRPTFGLSIGIRALELSGRKSAATTTTTEGS